MNTQQHFKMVSHYNQYYLQLSLPAGCDGLDEISCSDEYDYEVPDAEIEVNLSKLMPALEIMMLNQNIFHHTAVDASVSSDGYEGKLRQEYLKVYAHYVVDRWHFSFFLYFINEWSDAHYFMDLTPYFSRMLGTLDSNIVQLLKQQIPAA